MRYRHLPAVFANQDSPHGGLLSKHRSTGDLGNPSSLQDILGACAADDRGQYPQQASDRHNCLVQPVVRGLGGRNCATPGSLSPHDHGFIGHFYFVGACRSD